MAGISLEKREWISVMLGVALPGPPTPGDAGALAVPPADAGDSDDVAGFNAAKASRDWRQAALLLSFFSKPGLNKQLALLAGGQTAALHKGACENQDVGQNSPVALATAAMAHPTLSPQQDGRAAAIEQKLSPDDQKKYRALLDGAKSRNERQFISKGLAANHTVAELTAFAARIAGKDATWMQDNLSLTGASDGSGVKQQWHDACGPTTFEAVLGELDPLYALKKHEDNPNLNQADDSDATKANSNLAADQKALLEEGHGAATDRKTKGVGMSIHDDLNKVSASTGLQYQTCNVDKGEWLTKGVDLINTAADAGAPVPLVVMDGQKTTAHYVLLRE